MAMCDNSCGTVFCDGCGQEYYHTKAGIKCGHSPECGDDDDIDIDDGFDDESDNVPRT